MSDIPQSISLAICTRNRGAKILTTLQSVLACAPANLEIIVIDQSTNDITQNTINTQVPDARIRHIRTATAGLSRARNLAIASTQADILVFTDDDCSVPADYVTTFADIFRAHPKVAVAYCNVIPFPYDPAKGMVPDYIRKGDFLLKRLTDRRNARGIGAGMALRCAPVREMDGFDVMMGLGERFGAGEDIEIALRALMLGWHVYETDRIAVLHDGFRTWQDYQTKSARLDWYSIGSCYAKGLKAGYLGNLILILHELVVRIMLSPLRDLIDGRRPSGFFRPIYLLHGVIDGLRTPVDRQHILYK